MIKAQDDLNGIEGPGVSTPKDKRLDALADEFTEKRDQKAALAEKMTAIEAKIIDRMQELKLELYRYSDREVRIKYGKTHAKIKTVKVGDDDE